MKTQVIIFALLVSLVGFQANANSLNKFKGPKAKNAKAWDVDIKFYQPVVEDVEILRLKGPELKNLIAFERLSEIEKSSSNNVEIIKGPKAKNQRPF